MVGVDAREVGGEVEVTTIGSVFCGRRISSHDLLGVCPVQRELDFEDRSVELFEGALANTCSCVGNLSPNTSFELAYIIKSAG